MDKKNRTKPHKVERWIEAKNIPNLHYIKLLSVCYCPIGTYHCEVPNPKIAKK